MQLTLHADYAFRVLIYLGTHRDELVRTHEISDAYGISKNHLVRVIQTLERHGYVHVSAGRTGGVSLAREPEQIRLGQVIRDSEPTLRLVECFERETNTCPIAASCSLKQMLAEALNAFVTTLDNHTLADVVSSGRGHHLRKLLTIGAPVR